MAIKFNPLTGNFDFTGSGGGGGSSYIDGEVATYGDLPLDGTATLNSAWLVRTASGVWPVTRKQAGIYIRTATGGSNRDSDYTYAGTMPDVFSDSQFLLYDNSDSSRNLAFDLGSISTGTTRTLTVPDASATIAVAATRSVVSYSTDQSLPATRNTQLIVSNSNAGGINLDLPPANTNDGDIYTFIGATVSGPIVIRRRSLASPEIWTEQARITTEGQNHTFRATGSGNNNWELISANWAKPNAIGSTTPAAISGTTGTFTTLTANNGTLTASAPVLDLAQTWNNLAVNYVGLRLNITNTQSATGSAFASFELGGVQQAFIRRDGRIVGSNVYGGGAGLESSLLPQGVAVGSNAYIGFCSSSFANDSGGDLRLFRDAADTLAQRRTTNPQTFRIYNSFTSATNFERLAIGWASNVVSIKPEAGGAGGTVRELHISGLPTANPGPGILWNDGGTVKVGT